MSIRKFRKMMRPTICVIGVFFLISLLTGFSGVFGLLNAEELAFRLNGKKVSMQNLNLTMSEVSRQMNAELGNVQNVDQNLVNTLIFNDALNKYLILEMADDLNIKASNSDVKAELKNIKNALGGDEQYQSYLRAQGLTTNLLERIIKENLIIQAFLQKISDNIVISNELANQYYLEGNYRGDKTKIVDNIKEQLKNEEVNSKYYEMLHNARSKMKIEDLNENLNNFVEKEQEGFQGKNISNLDYINILLSSMNSTSENLDEAKELANKNINEAVEIIDKIKNKGVEINNNLPLLIRLEDSYDKYYSKLKTEIKPTEEDVKKFFDENIRDYNIPAVAKVEMIVYNTVISENDKMEAKTKAERILSEATPENFEELAKENSDDSSGQNGGKLGEFSKNQMVKPFEEASFSGEVGKVYPKLVETQFGYHIIYVTGKNEEKGTVTASHILIMPKISDATMKNSEINVEKISEILNSESRLSSKLKDFKNIVYSNEITVFSAKTSKSKEVEYYTEPNIDGIIPKNIVETLEKDMFKSKLGVAENIQVGTGYIIYKKIFEKPEIEAKYELFKEAAKARYIKETARKNAESLLEKK